MMAPGTPEGASNMPWTPIGSVAFELMLPREVSAESEESVRRELLTDLASGAREAVGIARGGSPEPIPPHLWAYVEFGEGLHWSQYDPFQRYEGDYLMDFRCDALGVWEPDRWGQGRSGYRVLYSDIRVSQTTAGSSKAAGANAERLQSKFASVSPGPKLGRLSGKALCVTIAQQILTSPEAPARQHGFKKRLAQLVQEQLHAEGLAYELSSIERILRDLKVV
jgi:hypothetical protein